VILVVEDGRIVELGSHAELYGRGGRYRELAELQLGEGSPRQPAPTSVFRRGPPS
jgi:hypothetical protein